MLEAWPKTVDKLKGQKGNSLLLPLVNKETLTHFLSQLITMA